MAVNGRISTTTDAQAAFGSEPGSDRKAAS